MVNRYKVTIEDEVYQVSVESIEEDTPSARPIAPSARTGAPAPRPTAPTAKPTAPTSRPSAKPAVTTGSGKTVVAPLPGNMWKVKTAAGQAVKRGDVLFIIEAMKMENEIFAPCDGTVTSVSVSEGGAVNTRDVLCVIG